MRGRIRGHSQLQGKHEAFEEVFRQLWDLFWKDLADEGDELVVLVTQRGELEKSGDRVSVGPQNMIQSKYDSTHPRVQPHLQQVLRHEWKNNVDTIEHHICC